MNIFYHPYTFTPNPSSDLYRSRKQINGEYAIITDDGHTLYGAYSKQDILDHLEVKPLRSFRKYA